MSFSESGGVITQAGTDTNLSGLSGVAGVTVYNNIYILDNVFLRVEGDLSFNGMDERIVFVNGNDSGTGLDFMSIYVDDGASLTITCDRGVQFVGFVERTVFAPAVDFGTRQIPATSGGTTDYDNGRKFISSHPNSTVNLSGVFVAENSEASGVMTSLTGTTTLTDFKFITKTTANQNHQYSFEGVVNLTNAELIGGSLVDRGGTYTFDGFTAGECNFGFLFGGAVVVDKSVTVSDLSTYNIAGFDININMAGTNSRGVVFLKNSEKSAGESTYGFSDDDGFSAVVFQSEITFNFTDDSFLSIDDVSMFARDVNNGGRNGTIVVPDGADIDTDPDRIYAGNTVAGTISFEPYTAFVTKIGGVPNIDNRGGSDGSNLTFVSYAYGYGISPITPDLIGLGAKTIDVLLVPDLSITVGDKVTVDAYTEIETAAKAYDRIQSYLYDNYAGETETIVVREGNSLNCRALDVVVDATASQVVDLTGNTLTIKASDFTDQIETTGAVTTTNGATISGGIIDSTADSFLSFSGIDTWKTFANQNDANLDQNELGSGLVTEIFRFNFVASTDYFLRLVVGDETFLKTVTPLQSGETEVSLSTTAILTSQGETVNEINQKLGFINRIIYCDTQLPTNGDGSNGMPFNVLSDAINLFNSDSYSMIELKTSLMSPAIASQSLAGVKVKGASPLTYLVLNNVSAQGAEFDDVLISGVQASGDSLTVYRGCTFVDDCSGVAGNLINSQVSSLTGSPITIGFQAPSSINCATITSVGDVTFDMNGQSVAFRKLTGSFIFSNITTGTCSLDSFSGELTVDASCNGGSLRVNDTLDITDNSTGTTLNIKDLPTAEESYSYFTSSNREDAFKADTSSLATQASVDNLNDFNPAVDVVANVALVGTTTTNTDMRGTDSANTIAPDNAGITQIQADINNLNDISPAQVNAEVDTALGDYDAPTKAELDAAESNIIAAIPSVGNIADSVWDEPYNQHTTAGTFGKLMDILRKANRAIEGEVTGTPTTTSFTTDITGYASGAFNSEVMVFVSGTINGEARPILNFNSTSGTFNFEEAWTQAPSTGDEFIILPYHVHAISEIQAGLAKTTELDSAETAILNAIGGLNDLTQQEVAEAVWDYLQSATTVSASMKEAVQKILVNANLIPATV